LLHTTILPSFPRRRSSDLVMLPKDYVRFRLSGDRAIDLADASGTLLLDVAHRRWSREVLQATEIDEALLPPLYESPDVCGKVSGDRKSTRLNSSHVAISYA